MLNMSKEIAEGKVGTQSLSCHQNCTCTPGPKLLPCTKITFQEQSGREADFQVLRSP